MNWYRKALLVASLVALPLLASAQAITTQATGTVRVYFSPNGGAEQAVVHAIRAARSSILVQAYAFTDAPIYQALADAKGRGVDVRILVDKEYGPSVANLRGDGARYARAHGVPVKVDAIPGRGIAHNKVIIIDADTVLTGSFNFSRAAETTNAENLVVFHHCPALAAAYTDNWAKRAVLARDN